MSGLRLLVAMIFIALSCGIALAHDPSKSYLNLTFDQDHFAGQWDVPLRDLQTVVPLGLDTNGIVTYEKLHEHYYAITDYIFARLKISLDGEPAKFLVATNEPVVEEFSDGVYLEIPFVISKHGPLPEKIELDYNLFFDINSLHRGLLRLEANDKTQVAVFTPEHTTQQFQFAVPRPGRQFLTFLREGVWHIWTGYDHILFLLALLLPSVLQREAGQWRAVTALRPACVNILKIVTAFTLAHSLTLTLATLGIVRLPSRLTESAIAASVMLAAANNLWLLIRERGWLVAFGFGLIHGFGFATALGDLGLVQSALWLTLVGFNLGVEIGQLAIVAVFLPAAFSLRRTWFYQKPLLRAGSVLIILIAALWFAERVFDFKILPF